MERDLDTLRNQGYRSGTGFGHGKRRLTMVPAMTVMPAFLTARTGAASRRVFASALEARGRTGCLRGRTRQCLPGLPTPGWRGVHHPLTHGHAPVALTVAGPSGRPPPRGGAPGRT